MKKLKWTCLILFLTLLTLFGDQGLLRLIELKKMTRRLEKESLSLAHANRELAQEIERLKQPEYLDRLIREERGYIGEGEQLVEIPNSP